MEMKSEAKGEINVTEQLKKATYKKANLPNFVSKIAHLSQDQRDNFLWILLKHKAIFQGKRQVDVECKFFLSQVLSDPSQTS